MGFVPVLFLYFLCIVLEKKIKEQEKLDDDIYILGLKSVRNTKQQLDLDGRILERETLEHEIEITKLEIEKDKLKKDNNKKNNNN